MNSPMIEALFEKIISEIDFKDLAKEIAPDLKKMLKKKLLENLEDADFSDVIYDIVNGSDMAKAISSHLMEGLKLLKDPATKTTAPAKAPVPKKKPVPKNKPTSRCL